MKTVLYFRHGLTVFNTNHNGHEALDTQWKWTRYNPNEADIEIDLLCSSFRGKIVHLTHRPLQRRLLHSKERPETVFGIATQPNSCHSKWQQLDGYSLLLVTSLHPCNNAICDPVTGL